MTLRTLGPFTKPRPQWVTSAALNRWAPLPSSNTLASLNPDLDPAVNQNHPGEAPWRRNNSTGQTWFGNFNNIVDWCGAVVNTEACEMWWPDAGGHASMPDAASYKLVLDAPVPHYVRVNTPSGAKNRMPLDYLAEMARGTLLIDLTGRPRTQHTANLGFWFPGYGPGSVSSILLANSGGADATSRPRIMWPDTGDTRFIGANNANNAAGGWDAAAYDPVRRGVWKFPTSTFTTFGMWGGPDNDVWVRPTTDAFNMSGACSMCYVPGHDVFLFGNGGGTGDDPREGGNVSAGLQTIIGGWGVFDPATGLLHGRGALRNLIMQDPYPTFTGAPTAVLQGMANTGVWPGASQPQWAPSLGAALVWDNYGTDLAHITRITPPASGNPRTGTWNIDYLPLDPGNTVVPPRAWNFGTYGRFGVYDRLGICFALPRFINEAGYFFRYR